MSKSVQITSVSSHQDNLSKLHFEMVSFTCIECFTNDQHCGLILADLAAFPNGAEIMGLENRVIMEMHV